MAFPPQQPFGYNSEPPSVCGLGGPMPPTPDENYGLTPHEIVMKRNVWRPHMGRSSYAGGSDPFINDFLENLRPYWAWDLAFIRENASPRWRVPRPETTETCSLTYDDHRRREERRKDKGHPTSVYDVYDGRRYTPPMISRYDSEQKCWVQETDIFTEEMSHVGPKLNATPLGSDAKVPPYVPDDVWPPWMYGEGEPRTDKNNKRRVPDVVRMPPAELVKPTIWPFPANFTGSDIQRLKDEEMQWIMNEKERLGRASRYSEELIREEQAKRSVIDNLAMFEDRRRATKSGSPVVIHPAQATPEGIIVPPRVEGNLNQYCDIVYSRPPNTFRNSRNSGQGLCFPPHRRTVAANRQPGYGAQETLAKPPEGK